MYLYFIQCACSRANCLPFSPLSQPARDFVTDLVADIPDSGPPFGSRSTFGVKAIRASAARILGLIRSVTVLGKAADNESRSAE